MSTGLFTVLSGVNINQKGFIITTEVSPATDEPISTLAIGAKDSEVEGDVYIKILQGVGEDKWLRLLNSDDLATLTNTISTLTALVNSLDAVIGNQDTGWIAPTGIGLKTGYETYTAPNIGILVDVEEVQDIANHLQTISQTTKSLVDALLSHGLLGS